MTMFPIIIALTGIFSAPHGLCDEFHLKNLLIGERAAGLGGAYSAISDDPSGIFYNPAGLAYSLENYFSLSANAYTATTQTFKNIVSGQDYVLLSQNLVPSFFGFTQTYGEYKVGFAIVVPNYDLVDQEDVINNISTTEGGALRLQRKFFRTDVTYLAGPAIARELFKNVTIGFTLFVWARIDKAINNQFIVYNPYPDGKYYFQNSYFTRYMVGTLPKIGVQFMPLPKWSIGITASKPFNWRGISSGKVTALKINPDDGKPITPTGSYSNDVSDSDIGSYVKSIPDPFTFTIGNAYFASKETLLSMDWDFTTADSYPAYDTAFTYNWSLGAEHYLSDRFAVRGGVFTNNAITQDLSPTGTDQPDHVDLLGATLSFSVLRPGSSFTVGGGYSTGTGEGQIISGVTQTQELNQTNLTVFLTGSYQL